MLRLNCIIILSSHSAVVSDAQPECILIRNKTHSNCQVIPLVSVKRVSTNCFVTHPTDTRSCFCSLDEFKSSVQSLFSSVLVSTYSQKLGEKNYFAAPLQ